MFSEIFKSTLLPILLDVGKVLFYCSTVYGIYNIMRREIGEGAERIKWAAIGYIALRLIDLFMTMVDKIAINMMKHM